MSNELKTSNVSDVGNVLPPAAWQFPSSQDPVVLLRRYLMFLAAKWWIVLVCVLFFATLAAVYVFWWPEKYATIAHIWVSGQSGIKLNEGATYTEDNLTYAGTQAQLLQSDQIMERAYEHVTNTLHMVFPMDSLGEPKLPKIKVSQLPKSAVLELTAKGHSPELTMAFLDALMEEFITYKREVRATTSGDTYTSVSDQIKRQESDLTAAQNELTTYMRDNNVAVLEEQAKAASVYLTQLLAESSDLKVELQLVNFLLTQDPSKFVMDTNLLAGASSSSMTGDSISQGDGSPIQQLVAVQELQKLRILHARLSQYLRPEHPKMVKLDEQIAEGEKLVEFMSGQNRDQLDITSQTIDTKLKGLQANIKEWEGKINDTSQRLAECELLKENVDRLQELQDHLLGLLQTVDVSKNMDQDNINILDHPSLAKSAKHSLLMAVFLIFFGFGFGLVIVFLLQRLDDRVHSLEELTEHVDDWVMGIVPDLPQAKSTRLLSVPDNEMADSELILTENDSRHGYVESYRNLRSALLFLPTERKRPKTLLVASSVPNEGKSTVAANLAKTIALGGSKVLLVDADLRCGKLHKLMGFNNEIGLSDLLKESVEPAKHLQVNSHSNLSFISRGTNHPDPGNLLLSPKLELLLQRWRQEFDFVIIDTCPVFAADDAVALASKVDGTLLVVRNNYSRFPFMNEALDMLVQRQARILGIIYNRAKASGKANHYYKYAEYGGATPTRRIS